MTDRSAVYERQAYEAWVVAKDHGEAERIWVRRCDKGCTLVSAWQVRGATLVVVAPFRPSPAAAQSLGLIPPVKGRAWPAGSRPEATHAVGCRHGIWQARITTEPRATVQ